MTAASMAADAGPMMDVVVSVPVIEVKVVPVVVVVDDDVSVFVAVVDVTPV